MSQNKNTNKNTFHQPVLLNEVLETLQPVRGGRYLDLTAGYGGHAQAILARTDSDAVLVDRDGFAVEALQQKFADDNRVSIIHGDFLQVAQQLVEAGEEFDYILADLGVSSPHLDNADRGFSITQNSRLDMRMDQRQGISAYELVNNSNFDELVSMLSRYGEEPKSKTMARAIIAARPIETTHQLADVAKTVWPFGSKVHPATRLFQALRIGVNDELNQIEMVLALTPELLKSGGRLAVISFHSLEDRIVKNYFKEQSGERYDAKFSLLTNKPLSASANELVLNPRSRSAKLRAVQRK